MMRLKSSVQYNDRTINGMMVYLSKKITIPTKTELQCVEWNQNTDFVATGGSGGVMKVVKLAPIEYGGQKDIKGLGAATNLSVNQNLEGHSGTVVCLTWNEVHQKLTSSDSNGLITVWALHNESWYEEMINNRNKSVVVGMAWNFDGSRIAIAYQDGQVIVGTNDGNRIWNKDLPTGLAACDWSPDGNMLLFGTSEGEVHCYDIQGIFLQKVHMVALENVELEAALAKDLRKDSIITLKWWYPVPKCRMFDDPDSAAIQKKVRLKRMNSIDSTMSGEPIQDTRPKLMIAYAHGVIQLMRNDTDATPIVARFKQVTISCARWSSNGSFIAVAGLQTDMPPQEQCCVHVLSAYGVKLTSLKIPGTALSGCAWDPTSMRIAISIDSNLYYGNVRPFYKWGYCGQTVIYAYEREDRNEFRVVFYETKMDEAYPKSVRNLEQMACFDNHCLLVNRANDPMGTFFVQLCNGIGTPVDYKYVDVEPKCVALHATTAVIAGSESYFIWHFTLPQRSTMSVGTVHKQQDDVVHVLDNSPIGNELGMRRKFQRGNDSISAICMGDTFFLAACESGALFKIGLSDGAVQQRFSVPQNIVQMSLNSTFKRIATLDHNSSLQFFDLEETSINKVPSMERKDVWSFCWESENEDTIAYNEKGKMVVMRNGEMEDPMSAVGYICSFKGLTVRTVVVEYFLLKPENPERKYVVDIEIKSLRDAKYLLERMKIQEASQYIERNPHPRLWSLLAEVALKRLDTPTAEHAFVMLNDYCGLQFCKRLKNVQSNEVKKAEVQSHLGKFEEAERIYVDNDRRDLAIEMYRKTHDWINVLKLLNQGGVGGANEDTLRQEAWNKVGDHYADRQKWEMAAKHYEQAHNVASLFNCYVHMDDFVGLGVLERQLPDGHPLLDEIGYFFGASGLCEQAVKCYIRNDKVKAALDVCIRLNQWDMAVELSRIHNLRDVDGLLSKHAAELTGSNERTLAAVQLYRRAGKFLDAARIVYEIADEERKRVAECLRLKKLYVMAALLIEEYRTHNRAKVALEKGKKNEDASVALSGLLEEDTTVSLEDSRMIDRAWRGALAYHFFMMAQRQLYEGNPDAAMKTSMHLTEYEDILDPVEVYSLLALSSCANRQFSVSSRAFIKLETLDTNENKEEFQQLALNIFSKYPPTDTRQQQVNCTGCEKLIPDYAQYCSDCDTKFPICIASGRPLMDYQFWLCPVCRQRAYEQFIQHHQFCPLCHEKIV